ncbi:hypothetical protein D7Y42_03820 [Stenotrophomonas maltophilia]|nr:hypothetical protein [Stenotrophomonas maltophilia]
MKLPKIKLIHAYPTAMAVLLTFGTPVLCILATWAFGELCWPQRVGAIYVGLSVLAQGYLSSGSGRFQGRLSDGHSLATHINQSSYTLAVFGTLFAAFGDLLPPGFYYGVAMCPP